MALVAINPEARVKVREGPAVKELVKHGWRAFLVKVVNEGGVTSRLVPYSANALPLHQRSSDSPSPPITVPPSEVLQRFLDLELYTDPPMKETLTGLPLEYAIVVLYSRDQGPREVQLGFHVGHGTQDLGFRSETSILFDCVPAIPVELTVLDFDGTPTTASFVVKDDRGRVYPAPTRRLAPDFFFHEQVYRHQRREPGPCPPGEYRVRWGRGPEYRRGSNARIEVTGDVATHHEDVRAASAGSTPAAERLALRGSPRPRRRLRALRESGRGSAAPRT